MSQTTLVQSLWVSWSRNRLRSENPPGDAWTRSYIGRWLCINARSVQRSVQHQAIQWPPSIHRHTLQRKSNEAIKEHSKPEMYQSPGQDIIRTVVGVMAPSIPSLKLVMKSIASTQPWRYDHTVLELPWKDHVGLDSESKRALGLFENDGIVSPQPPMARALRIASAAVQDAGHKVIPSLPPSLRDNRSQLQILQWQPPTHARSGEIHVCATNALQIVKSCTYSEQPPISRGDGMPDVVENINLSGEPFVPEIAKMFPGGKAKPSIPLLDFENATLSLKTFRSDYHKYWESTAEHTGTGRPVDAVLFPAGPHTAPLPGKSYWFSRYSHL